MTDGERLQEVIDKSGVSIVFIAREMGKSRNRVYAILRGADCSASEIVSLTEILHLNRETRDAIFFKSNSEFNSLLEANA